MEKEWLKGLFLFEQDHQFVYRYPLLVAEWKRSYPHVDIKSQTAWAHAWLVSNPKKIKKDFPRYLNNWMKTTEERLAAGTHFGAPPLKVPERYEGIPEIDLVTGEMFKQLKEQLRGIK